MVTPLDPSTLPPLAQKALDLGAPAKMREATARGIVMGAKPGDILTVVALLSQQGDDAAKVALQTLQDPASKVVANGIGSELHPAIIDVLALAWKGNDDLLEKLVQKPNIDDSTLASLAATASERVTEVIATNEARLLTSPTIIEKLYMNRNTRMSTADRLIDLAVRNHVELKGIPAFREAAAALQDELIPEASEEPTPDDLDFREAQQLADTIEANLAGAEVVQEDEKGEAAPTQKALPIHAKLAQMSISGRIRRAQLGTKTERELLLRDTNKLVAAAAIRSPQVQEQDVEKYSKMRTVHDEVLRYIAQRGEWLENHQIKVNLVTNPRTPFMFVSKLIPHLRADELKRLEKSRDVTAAVRSAVKAQLKRKGKE